VSGLSEGRTIAKARCTRIRDLWDPEDREWKSFSTFEMNSHIFNRTSRDIIISNIPWNPAAFPSGFKIGDWISSKAMGHLTPFTWIY
jgi:hypothetical protein